MPSTKIRPSDEQDNAPIYFFSATRATTTGVTPRNHIPGNLISSALNIYENQLGGAFCRRRKIESIQIDPDAKECSIDTWLAFLCFIDEDVQRDEFRISNPDDYRPYLGDLDESSHFINMARYDCRNIIGVIPKNHRLSKSIGINTNVDRAIIVFVIASHLAGFDYVMLKRKEAEKNKDCGPPFVIRKNNLKLYAASMGKIQQNTNKIPNKRGGNLRNEYGHYWLFCRHSTGSIRGRLHPYITGDTSSESNESTESDASSE